MTEPLSELEIARLLHEKYGNRRANRKSKLKMRFKDRYPDEINRTREKLELLTELYLDQTSVGR